MLFCGYLILTDDEPESGTRKVSLQKLWGSPWQRKQAVRRTLVKFPFHSQGGMADKWLRVKSEGFSSRLPGLGVKLWLGRWFNLSESCLERTDKDMILFVFWKLLWKQHKGSMRAEPDPRQHSGQETRPMVSRDGKVSGVGNMREVDWRGAGYWEKEGGIRERKKCRWTLWFLERGFWSAHQDQESRERGM